MLSPRCLANNSPTWKNVFVLKKRKMSEQAQALSEAAVVPWGQGGRDGSLGTHADLFWFQRPNLSTPKILLPFLPPGPWILSLFPWNPYFLSFLRLVIFSIYYLLVYLPQHINVLLSLLPEQKQVLNLLLSPPLVSIISLSFPSHTKLKG